MLTRVASRVKFIKKSNLSDNRKSETPRSWTNLQNCANGAHHDKSQTMARRHLWDPRNQERSHTTTGRNFSIAAASKNTASGAVWEDYTARELPAMQAARTRKSVCSMASTLLFQGYAYHDNPPVTHDTKLTNRLQISATCAEKVRCTSN